MHNKKLDTYLDLCTEVYDLSKPMPPKDEYEFYRSYAKTAHGPILEPMCGTGRFLLSLFKEGFDISGFDASHDMLNCLYNKAKSRKLHMKVWYGFLKKFNTKQKYALIFIPSGSFGLIIEPDQVKLCLKEIYNHLTNGGTFIFEVETLSAVSKQVEIWRGNIWQRDDGKNIISNFLDLPLKDDIATTICKYELVGENELIKTEIEEIRIRLYKPAHMLQILKETGFRSIRAIKAFNKNKKPGKGDKSVIYECIR